MHLQIFIIVIFVNLQPFICFGGPAPILGTLPNDLIEIAITKLGIKSADQIPSLQELHDLLGTSTREDTINTIRQLTATETGIHLIKAFLDIPEDYTDDIETTTSKPATKSTPKPTSPPVQIKAEESRPSLPTSLLSETIQKDLDIVQKILTTPKPELGFFGRVSSYLNYFDLFPENKEIPIAPVTKAVQELDPILIPKEEELKPEIIHNKHEHHYQHNLEHQKFSHGNYPEITYGLLSMPGLFRGMRETSYDDRILRARAYQTTKRPRMGVEFDRIKYKGNKKPKIISVYQQTRRPTIDSN